MKSWKVFWIFLSVFLLGCKMTPDIPEYLETRFDIPIELSEFNSVAGHYFEKPAFVSLITYPKNEFPETLVIKADGYGSSYNQFTGVTKNQLFVSFRKDEAQFTIDAIDKYLKWQEQALKAGDMFTKEIATSPAFDTGYGTSNYNKFKFYSGNKINHYLIFSFCSMSSLVGELCTDTAAMKKENAIKLREIAKKYKSGELKKEDVAAKYK